MAYKPVTSNFNCIHCMNEAFQIENQYCYRLKILSGTASWNFQPIAVLIFYPEQHHPNITCNKHE